MDEQFLDAVADRLAALPGVLAVSLGGSRAAGTYRPDSDWDLAIYYRGRFDPGGLRAIGWAGQVCEIGDWGGGVFNGGAWLEIDGRRVDVHYRDLDRVEHEVVEATAGRFGIEPLAFHLVGIPTYLAVAELAGNRLLRGDVPRPDGYPAALRRCAPPVWWSRAQSGLAYAVTAHARSGRLTPCVGLLAQGALQTAHAVAAAQGQWVTNDKTLWDRAGIAGADDLLGAARPEPAVLGEVAERMLTLCEAAVRAAVGR